MINRVEFENFRGLKHMQLGELSPITLLTGRNNAGKSSILEGIFLFMDHAASESFGKLNVIRGMMNSVNPSSQWEPVFYNMDMTKPMKIHMVLDGKPCDLRYERDDSYVPADSKGAIQNSFSQFSSGSRSTFTLKYQYKESDYSEDGFFSINDNGVYKTVNTSLPNNQIRFLPDTRFVNPLTREDLFVAEWLGRLELMGAKEKIISILKLIEPDITDITTISNQGQIQLYIKLGGQLLPVRLAGDGLNRLLYFLLILLVNQNMILLIDEIDAGFHYSVLEQFWGLLASAAKQSNCQIIATTHSYECIQGALCGIKAQNMEQDFCLYRVEKTREGNRALRYDADLTRFAVDANVEVR